MTIHVPRFVTVLAATLAFGAAAFAQTPKVRFPQPSPSASLKQQVGIADIEISYNRPSVKGRKVFGELAPFGEVWRTGANNATRFKVSSDFTFGGVAVPAGEYALFSIPDQNEWTVILNKNTKQWGSYTYDQANDVARVKAKPVTLSNPVETFTIDLNDLRDESATLNLTWDKTRVPVKLEFAVTAEVQKQIEAAIAGSEKPDAGLQFQAALFYLEHDLDLNKAEQWVAEAIKAQPDAFYMYYHQARILAKKGDKAGALAAARTSMEKAKTSNMGGVKEEYTRLNERLIQSLGQ